MSPRRRAAALAASCAAATFAVFSPALFFPFLNWDDGPNVAANPHLDLSVAGLRWMLTGFQLGHWHPLTWLTLAVDRAAWGPGPFGPHLTNVLLHALSAALLFLLARRLLGTAEKPADAAALLAALAWSLHPLRVESVAWISERRDVLSGALALACVLAYVRGRARLALAFGAAAMAAKVFAVVLPAVLLVVDLDRDGRPRWKEKLPWLAPAVAALWLNMRAQAEAGAAIPWAAFGLRARLAQAAYGLAFYPWKTLWPSGLAPLYERSLLLEPAPFLVAAVATAAAAAALWTQRRRRPRLVRAVLAYALLVLPALGLFKSGRMTAADRYAYLSGIPLSLIAGAALARVPRAAGFVVLAIFAVLTTRQLPVWSSDVALWTRACEASPLSYFARLKLAAAEDAAGRPVDAAADRRAAEALHAEVFARAAESLDARGDAAGAEAARARARRGLEIAP